MTIKKTLLLAVALGVVAAPAWAQESTPPPAFAPPTAAGGGFGGTGQWVLSLGGTNDNFFFLHKQSGGGWQLQILPALDYFITSSVSIGGAAGFRHDSGGDTPVTIGARAGFNINITGPVGFWPLAGVFATHVFHPHGSDNSATLRIFAPFLFHLAPHFFIGGGPSFDLSLTSDGNQFGLDILLGGWI